MFSEFRKDMSLLNVRILFSDQSLLVCEKPVGISSESPGLPELLKEKTHTDCYPVHRLDIGTGGACVLALNQKTSRHLQLLFQNGKIKKEYLAVIAGMPESASGEYNDFLFHDTRINKTYVVSSLRKGVKKASCSWNLLETAETDGQAVSLIRVRLATGRTHQIRVQFASRGVPLVGDRRYGSKTKSGTIALWSNRICFQHPEKPDQTVNAVSIPPSVFPWVLFPSLN